MKKTVAFPLSSSQPDARVLEQLAFLQRAALLLVTVIGSVEMAAWLLPGIGQHLPPIWTVMKPNTAACALLSALSLYLQRQKQSGRNLTLSRGLAALVGAIAVFTLLEYWSGRSFGSEHWLTVHWVKSPSGRMSPQTALSFALLSLVMIWLRLRKHILAYAIDLLAMLHFFTVSVIVSGYLFGAIALFGVSMQSRVSPQTLVCLGLLSFVAFSRRAEYGVFTILLGVGIGSRVSRIAIPAAVALPYVLEIARLSMIRDTAMQSEIATALTTSFSALVAFCLILALTWRISDLEKAIQDLSLRDELTKIYNRRGFLLIAEQARRQAKRSGVSFAIVFIDLDNLKKINDALGHDMGSELLCDMATTLMSTFRETDIVGRLGGDEFVVAAEMNGPEVRQCLGRLAKATSELNAGDSREYTMGYSAGFAVSGPDGDETLDMLLENADMLMYQAKRAKKMQRPLTVVPTVEAEGVTVIA